MTELALELFTKIIHLLPAIIGLILFFTILGDLLFSDKK